EPDANNIAMTTMKTRMKHTPFAVPLYDLGRPLAHVFFTPTACKSGKLRWALKPERPHETHWKPRRPFATMDRAVQAGEWQLVHRHADPLVHRSTLQKAATLSRGERENE